MHIVYEDDWILVVDKPAGLAVHAAQGVPGPDLLTQLRVGRRHVTLLHRLDREASGLLVGATRPDASAPLQRQLEAHAIRRTYLAILGGRFAGVRTIDRPIPERAQGRAALRKAPPPDALPARSRFRALRALAGATLVEVVLETGRKHQIRVHAASIGHPILGDRRYGGRPAPRLALHASRLELAHPADGRAMVFTAEMPGEMAEMVGSDVPSAS